MISLDHHEDINRNDCNNSLQMERNDVSCQGIQGLGLKVVCLPIKRSFKGFFALRLVAKADLCSFVDLNLLT